ncbi:Flavin-containing monooxygenase [Psidium guajava]|nr:Flavin-containing monooxygenase [Psidium guajava]
MPGEPPPVVSRSFFTKNGKSLKPVISLGDWSRSDSHTLPWLWLLAFHVWLVEPLAAYVVVLLQDHRAVAFPFTAARPPRAPTGRPRSCACASIGPAASRRPWSK